MANILYYGPPLVYGGALQVMIGLVTSLARKGHDVTVFVDDARGATATDALSTFTTVDDAMRRWAWVIRGPWRSWLRNILIAACLLRSIFRRRVQCVIVDVAGNVERIAWLKAFGLVRVPVIARCGTLLMPKIADAARPERARRWYRRMYARADLVVVPSRHAQQDFIAATSLAEPVVIFNGVDAVRIEQFARERPEPRTHTCFTIAFSGLLVDSKGLPLLFDAMQKLQLEYGVAKSAARVIVLGDGPRRAAYVKESIQRGEGENYLFLGTQANPWKYIAEASCFVACGRYDGFMLALIEAALLGVPVIYPDAGVGAAELLVRFRIGRQYRAGDADSLAEALHAEMENPTRASPDALASLRNACSVSACVDAYDRIITQLVRASIPAREGSAS